MFFFFYCVGGGGVVWCGVVWYGVGVVGWVRVSQDLDMVLCGCGMMAILVYLRLYYSANKQLSVILSTPLFYSYY